jgi:tetratricopeptide (TPR) repeat protein
LEVDKPLSADFPERKDFHKRVVRGNVLLASCLRQQGKLAEAEQLYRQVLEVHEHLATEHPENSEYEQQRLQSLRKLARNLLRQGKGADAAQLVLEQSELDQATELENNDWFYTRLAIYHATGQTEKAEAELEKRLAKAPNKDEVRLKYARNLHSLGMLDDAIVAHRKASELASRQPFMAIAMFNLGCAYALKGDHGRAFEALNKSIELGELRLKLFQNDSDLADLRDDDRFDQLLKKLEWTSFAEAARKYAANGELPEAIAQMSEAAGLNPNYWYPHYGLALMQLSSGDFTGYRKRCDTLQEVASQTKFHEADSFVAWTSALAPDAVDDYAPIIGLARGAVEASPENSKYLGTLGAILLRAGQIEEAVEKLTEVQQRDANDDGPKDSSPAYTQYFLAMAHHSAGEVAQASEALQEANTWTDKVLGETGKPVPWNRKLTLELLRSEATELLSQEDHAPVTSEPAKSDSKPPVEKDEKSDK